MHPDGGWTMCNGCRPPLHFTRNAHVFANHGSTPSLVPHTTELASCHSCPAHVLVACRRQSPDIFLCSPFGRVGAMCQSYPAHVLVACRRQSSKFCDSYGCRVAESMPPVHVAAVDAVDIRSWCPCRENGGPRHARQHFDPCAQPWTLQLRCSAHCTCSLHLRSLPDRFGSRDSGMKTRRPRARTVNTLISWLFFLYLFHCIYRLELSPLTAD
ncbi:hypothetical protein DFH06DRAFT_1470917 [Mycena polygramma]|nr:hypothetical protein DFH06DRAFT_1470917 [Mycena polygramma]